MAKQKYLISELDENTRKYLSNVLAKGQDLAGIYLPGGSPHASWAFPLGGLFLLGVVLFLVIPPLSDPTALAMLLTAGVLMGGWFILAGIRVGIAYARGYNLGSFIYVDPKQIWSVNNSVVERWPLKNVQQAVVDGQVLLLTYPDGVENVNIPYEIGIQEVAFYVGYWLEARGGGKLDQALIEAHAANARAIAYDQTPDQQPRMVLDIPVPKVDENTPRSRDWPILLALVVGGVALFFVIRLVMAYWHDHAVFQFVRSKGPPHWRAYLVDDRNTLYREEVRKMLSDKYEAKVTHLKDQIRAKPDADFKGSDEAMAELLLALTDAPQPIVTLRFVDATQEHVREKLQRANPMPLTSIAQTELTDAFYTAIGQDLITLAQPLADVPPLVDIQFTFVAGENANRLEWKLEIRKHPDSDPHYKTAWVSTFQQFGDAEQTFTKDLGRIKDALAGRVQ